MTGPHTEPDSRPARPVPAWRRATVGERRWPVAVAVLAVAAGQLTLPDDVVLGTPWLLPSLEVVLLAVLVVVRGPLQDESPHRRRASLVLTGVVSVGNASSVTLLVVGLLAGRDGDDPATLLASGATIWATNVIAFALWYWQFDRGGPAARARATREHPDFLFPQMQTPDLAPPEWEPGFVDYLYVAFTNATAFSPTDTMPLSRWAKATMTLQAAVSLVTVALVVARAVNVLR